MKSIDKLRTLTKAVSESTYKHLDKPGADAKNRKKLKKKDDKVEAVMGEFKRGTLRSGSGDIVTDRDQAVAIAMSEAGLSKKAENNLRDLLKARKTKYIRRVAKPGGGYKYYYTKKEVQASRIEPVTVSDFKPITEPKEMTISAMGLEQKVQVNPVDLDVGFDYNFGTARMKYPSGRKAWAIIDMDSGLTISSGQTGESLKRVLDYSAEKIKKRFKSREALLEKVQEAIKSKESEKEKLEKEAKQMSKEKAKRTANKKKKETEAEREASRIEQEDSEAEARRKGNAQERYEQALQDIKEVKEDYEYDVLGKDTDYKDIVEEYFGYDPLTDEDATAQDVREAAIFKNALVAAKNLSKLKDAAEAEAGQMKLFARSNIMNNHGMPFFKGRSIEPVKIEDTESNQTETNEAISSLRDLLKARVRKYIRRWKGKDGKWNYEYTKPGKQKPAASELEGKPKQYKKITADEWDDFLDLFNKEKGKGDATLEQVKKFYNEKTSSELENTLEKDKNKLKQSTKRIIEHLIVKKSETGEGKTTDDDDGGGESPESQLEDLGINKEHTKNMLSFLKENDWTPDDVTDVRDETYGYYIDVGGEEYFVATSYDDAFAAAKEDLESLIDDMGVTAFNESFWQGHIDTEKLGRELSMDSSHYYDEGHYDPEYYIDEEPAGEDGDWTDEQREKAGEKAEEQFTEQVTSDPLGYLNDIYGEGSEEYNNFIKNYVDEDALIEDAINTDGIAHTLGRYDGNEDEHGDMLFYRQN